ncbi:MAG: hypothetical protein CMH57_07200 [Myxococcales bacterium]|nr:hypothetical protein [Myxococcales bacterium]
MLGEVMNPLDEVVHRATLTGVAFARFSEETAFLKASSGSGFVTEVDSDHPWKPGEKRAFKVITRPLDPIYCLYTPMKALAALNLSMETPLGQRVEDVVMVSELPWGALHGRFVQTRDETPPQVRITDNALVRSPFTTLRLAPGDTARLHYISRDRGLVEQESRVGWMDMDKLALVQPGLPTFTTTRPTEDEPRSHRDLSYAITQVRRVLNDDNDSVSVRFQISNPGERVGRCSLGMTLMHSTGDSNAEPDEGSVERCRKGVEPGSNTEVVLSFMLPTSAAPLRVGFSGGPSWALDGAHRAP